MNTWKRTFDVSFLIAISLLLTNCGKKDFNQASASSEETAGVRDPQPNDPNLPELPGSPDTQPTNPAAKGDTCVGIGTNPNGWNNGQIIELAATATCVKDMTDAVLIAFSFLGGCEPSYQTFRVTKAQNLAFAMLSPIARQDAIRAQGALLRTHAATAFYCMLWEE